jgi:hypothetical protein
MNSPKSCGRALDLPAQAAYVEVADFSIADLNTRDVHQRLCANLPEHERMTPKLPPNATILFLINNLPESNG